jgi:hypothetical protein
VTERDPRIDPKPGDVLATPRSKRMVSWIDGEIIGVYYSTGGGFRSFAYAEEWKSWAKDAEVITKGPE